MLPIVKNWQFFVVIFRKLKVYYHMHTLKLKYDIIKIANNQREGPYFPRGRGMIRCLFVNNGRS